MKKCNYKIGVFDSGIGGLTTLKEIKKLLSNENYLYYQDNANLPYGQKNDDELFEIGCNIVEYFISKNVKMIVIACNTMTTKCINKLRNKYTDMIFVGAEPAIKVSCDKGYKNTLLLVTPTTAKSDRIYELINNYVTNDHLITILPCKGLADIIEKQDKNMTKFTTYSLLYEYKDYNYDSIILGCTHYIYIKKYLKEIFPNANIIDGNKGIAKRVKELLKENELLTDRQTEGKTITYISK